MRWIDACHGLGGFRLGFEAASAECVDAFDINARLVEHYRSRGWYSRIADILALQKVGSADLLVCGAPCQPFSRANPQREEDAENKEAASIPGRVFALARAHDIPVVLLENVEGLLSSLDRRAFYDVLMAISESGYDAQWAIVDCSLLGAPTKRTHLLIIAVARGARKALRLFTETDFERLADLEDHYPYRLTKPKNTSIAFGTQLVIDFDGQNVVRYRSIGTKEFEFIQGFPQGWTDDFSRGCSFQALADSFPPAAAYTIAKALMETL